MTISVTSDFRHAYQTATRERMRRRFLLYSVVMGCVQILLFALNWELFTFDSISLTQVGFGFSVLLSAFVFFGAHVYVKNASARLGRGAIVTLTVSLILAAALLRLPYALFGDLGATLDELTVWCVGVMLSHVVASCFIPWSAREALIPFAPVLAILAIVKGIEDGFGGVLGAVFLTLFLALPGTMIAWGITSQYRTRFQNRFLRKSYTSMKRELVDARRLHEDLFPKPVEEGPVLVRYQYEPMSQIGGDYLFVRTAPASTTVVLIDVTGHGIAAALTINRLQGEIQRTLGENPDLGPGEVLASLNRYIHLTLATHSVYATAVAFRAEHDAGRILYASAGHPPAFLIGVDTSIERLDSTTFMLGVTHGDDFQPNEAEAPFHPGDTLIAYTDGATEAQNEEGRMMGVMGFLRTVASAVPDERGWATVLRERVDEYRDGPPMDDTLIVEVVRPLGE